MRVHIVEPYHSHAMRRFTEPLLTASLPFSVTESDTPDWSADLNYFIPWHWLANNVPEGPAIMLYTHCNPGMEGAVLCAAGRSSAIIAMSKDGERELREIGVTGEITICHAPITGFSPRKRNILVVGSEQPNGRKRSWLLLELAWSMNLTPYHFTIVGGGWSDVAEKLRNCGVDVITRGNIEPEALQEVYRTADALLVTGFTEGGPLPVLEALASGIPCITPRYGYADENPSGCHYYSNIEELQMQLRSLIVPVEHRVKLVSDHTVDSYCADVEKVVGRVEKPGRPMSRYDWVPGLVDASKSRYLMEIGTWTGERALAMIEAAKKHHDPKDIHYYGYDLFEEMSPEMLEVERSKQPWSEGLVSKRLAHTGANIHLVKGNTHETLHPITPYTGGPMDFIFIDGGHSFETITSDWEGIQPYIGASTIILFDDCYYNDPEDVGRTGCQMLIAKLIANGKWTVEYLEPVEDWPQKDGVVLHIGMVKVTRE